MAGVLITLDSIIVQNPHLLPSWAQYKVHHPLHTSPTR